jgi:hypothetical protein
MMVVDLPGRLIAACVDDRNAPSRPPQMRIEHQFAEAFADRSCIAPTA